MYWWNVSQLAQDFQEGRVEEKERFKYYLAYSISTALVINTSVYVCQSFKILYLMSAAAAVTITVAGTILSYRANRSGDDTDFIARMICLSWPIGIRVLVLFLSIGVTLIALNHIVAAASGSEIVGDAGADVLGELLVLASEICIFWLLYKYITHVAHRRKPESAN
jgi:hypothetical protein